MKAIFEAVFETAKFFGSAILALLTFDSPILSVVTYVGLFFGLLLWIKKFISSLIGKSRE